MPDFVSALLVFVGCFFLPGFLLALAVLGPLRKTEAILYGLGLGFVFVPFLSFVPALFWGQYVYPLSVMIAAGVLAAIGIAGLMVRRKVRRGERLFAAAADRWDRWVLAASLAVGALYYANYDDATYRALNDLRVLQPLRVGAGDWCYLMAVRATVAPQFPDFTPGRNNLLGVPLAITYGNLATSGSIAAWNNRELFALFYAWMGLLLFLAMAEVGRRVFDRKWLGWIAGAALALNPYVLGIPLHDRNVMALMYSSVLLSLLFRNAPVSLLGLVFGFVAGVGLKHIPITFGPAICLYLYFCYPRTQFVGSSGRKTGLALCGLFLLAFLPTFFPWALNLAMGGVQHFARPHAQNLLGLEFIHRGLLQFPFASEIVRTPFNPYPVFLYFPLRFIQEWGVLAVSLILVGFWSAWRHSKGLFCFLIFWIAPISVVLALQENWLEGDKKWILTTIFAAPAVALAAGLEALLERKNWLWSGALCVLLVMFLSVTVRAAEHWNFPADRRFYYEVDQIALEDPGYIEQARREMTRAKLLPDYSKAQLLPARAPAQTVGGPATAVLVRVDLGRSPYLGSDWIRTESSDPSIRQPADSGSEVVDLIGSDTPVLVRNLNPASKELGPWTREALAALVVRRPSGVEICLRTGDNAQGWLLYHDLVALRWPRTDLDIDWSKVRSHDAKGASSFLVRLQEGEPLVVKRGVSFYRWLSHGAMLDLGIQNHLWRARWASRQIGWEPTFQQALFYR